MPRQRPISWSAALRDLHADRAPRAAVREDGSISGMRCWRGQSGHRYVVTPKARDVVPADAVVTAVARVNGIAHLVAVAAFDADAVGFPAFRALAHAAGATELQMHRLAATAAARATIVADLAPGARVDAAAFAARPLATSAGFDRKAIMDAARDIVRARQSVTGEAWAACIGPAMKAAWAAAKAMRAAKQN